jgi:hypothetical protein
MRSFQKSVSHTPFHEGSPSYRYTVAPSVSWSIQRGSGPRNVLC